ncbi:hypothetical protein ScPMuIL_005797 [Solemya velum]
MSHPVNRRDHSSHTGHKVLTWGQSTQTRYSNHVTVMEIRLKKQISRGTNSRNRYPNARSSGVPSNSVTYEIMPGPINTQYESLGLHSNDKDSEYQSMRKSGAHADDDNNYVNDGGSQMYENEDVAVTISDTERKYANLP